MAGWLYPGEARSADGIVDVDLSIPKAMGGPGKAGGLGLVASLAATVGMPWCSVAVVQSVATNVPDLRHLPCFDLSCFTFARKRRSAHCRGM